LDHFLIDLSICYVSLVVAYLIGHNLNFTLISLRELSSNLLVISVLNTLIFFNFKTYAGIVRYIGVQDAFRVIYSLLFSTGILGFLSLEVDPFVPPPMQDFR
jgi:FlaA1/EpsC-like NDP-sugar epimerase